MNTVKYFSKLRLGSIGKKLLKAFSIIAVIVIVASVASGFDFNSLQVTFYSTRSYKVKSEPVRVVLLTDLHLREFGKNNCELLDRVESLNPDLIAVAGDLTISGNTDYDVALDLLNNLSDIAPTYYSYGNHEFYDILFVEGCTLRKELDNTKATVLHRKYEKINIKGTDITIGGLCIGPDNFDQTYVKFMTEFCEQDGYKILLCHHPECYESVMEDYPVDLAFAGHAHGGQVILPVVGPLYAPDQGFLPDLTDGMQTLCGSTVVISRGLGNSSNIPRYNNDPEIVVVDIGNY